MAGLALLPISACRRSESPALNRAPRDANILLITLDTTRADHLGCYSTSEVRGAKTPNLDALAARGTRFARAVAQVPLTLPSHASIMTGAYPTVHGLRDMEGFLLDPSHPTIATIAQGNGFATAAFVGARVLAKSFGLAHGFGHYDDDMGSQPDDEDLTGTVAERRAGVVTQRALDWLQGNRGKRFFLWAHYFDPHAPYDPPEPYKQTYARDAYSGEIAYMDQEVGRLFEGLQQMGLEDQTLVAVLGDHGESLGEHGEMTHGVFLYDSTMRVPFLLAGPGVPHGKVVQEQVRSIDVMPTLLAFLNLAPGPEAQGISLWPRIEKELRLPSLSYSYGETLYPRTYMGWSELRAMRTDSWKLIVAPHPELYDLEQDPGEAHNLFAESPGEAARLRKKLLEVAGDFSRPQTVSVKPVDEKTLRDLQSLGYVGAGPRREIALGTKAPDPKDRAAVLKIFGQVEDLLNKKQYAPAARAAEQALRLDPTNPRAHLYLATAYEQMSQYPRAVEVLQHAADAGIDAARIYSRLGIDCLHLQRMDQAVTALERASRLNPMDLRNLLNLGMAYLQQNRAQDAERTFRAIIAQNGRYAPAHNGLGIVAAQRGDAEGARREFQSAMEADPREVKSLLDLGILYRETGDRKQALHYLRLFLDKVPPGQFADQLPAVRETIQELEKDRR